MAMRARKPTVAWGLNPRKRSVCAAPPIGSFREYCEPWWPAFAEEVLEHARLPVYGLMVKLLVGHLAAELGLPATAVENGQRP